MAMLSFEQARAQLLADARTVTGVEMLPTQSACGRVLAADQVSTIAVPPLDNSSMDGYALSCADVPAVGTRLAVAQRIAAGSVGHRLLPGTAARIFTGAPVPAGADAIVMQELTSREGDAVTIDHLPAKGDWIRRAGEDIGRGDRLLAAGTRLLPQHLGLAASVGLAVLPVFRRLKVALFSTGDELCSIGSPLAPGAVYDSNRYTLWGMLTRLGCEVIDMGVVKDEPAALEAAFREAANCADAIITSGGVSVGEADFIKQLMAQLGEVAFWKIAMKPGRPMAFGRINAGKIGDVRSSAWLFGLPGNPVAVMVTFYQFVQPALLRLMGIDPLPPLPSFAARCVAPMKKGKGRTEFQRGILFQENGEWCVRPTGHQGSGMLSSMAKADCFIVLEAEREKVAAGDLVQVQVFGGLV